MAIHRMRGAEPRVAEAAPLRPGGPNWRAEGGQGLVLGVLFLGLVLIFMVTVPGLGIAYAEHAGAQSAADAAALACATEGTITTSVDARGVIYGRTVAVDPDAGPRAGAVTWGRNLAYWPLATVSFAATPTGADCTVRAVVRSQLPLLSLLRAGQRGLRWGVSAEAKAYATPP